MKTKIILFCLAFSLFKAVAVHGQTNPINPSQEKQPTVTVEMVYWKDVLYDTNMAVWDGLDERITETWNWDDKNGGNYDWYVESLLFGDDDEGHNIPANYTNCYPICLPQEKGAMHVDGIGGNTKDRNATVKLVLHTGGRSGSKLQNLFALSASATEEFPVKDIGGQYHDAGIVGASTNIPYDRITIDGETLDANGVMYKVYPDGADNIDVTPIVNVPLYIVGTPGPTKYHCYFTAYAEMPNPNSGRMAIVDWWLIGLAGHGWWCLSSDAPIEGLHKAGISTASLAFLNDQVGYFPLVSLSSLFDPVPGVLKDPGNGGRVDASHLFQIGFRELQGGLDFTAGLAASPGLYSLWLYPHNCATTTVDAAGAAGISLPHDQTPQNLGIDLNLIPNQ